MKAERHGGSAPLHNHADQDYQGNEAEFGQPNLRERSTVLGGQIRQIVRELV
jgi:hypothetical protein